jgi:protein TonB
MARIAHINGKVVVRIRVDKEGHVAEEKGVSGHPILVQSVLDAVKKWQYRPVVVNGQPMEVLSYVAVGFNQ